MKKFIAGIIMMLTLIVCMAFEASALDASGSLGDNVTYTYDSGTGMVVISGTGAMNSYDYWYSPFFRSNIISVVIEDGVTTIGSNAFESCNSLKSITIPNSIEGIGKDAFSYCYNLKNVYISDIAAWCKMVDGSVPTYHSGKTNLYLNGELITDLVIPDSVTSIDSYAFFNCTSLKSLTIPDSVVSIEIGAFVGCANLKSVTIPDSVTYIESTAFGGCTNLESVTIPNSVKWIGQYAFSDCTSLRSVVIPDSVTELNYYTFLRCTALESITIPKSMTRIRDGAFYETNLKYVYYEGSAEEWNNIKIYGSNDSLLNAKIHYSNTHSYDKIVTAPTCTSQGYTTYICFCGDSYKSDYINAKGHSYSTKVTPPTCTAQGYTTYTCSCGYNYKDNYVNANGHSYNTKVTAPTCTAEGYTTYTCACGNNYKSDYVNATGHSYNETVTKEPTATTEGIKTYTCSCGDSYTETIPVTSQTDKNTYIKAEYDYGTFEEAPKMIIEKGGTNANFAFGGLFGKYTSFDITFEIDGEKVQPNGKVTVRIPIIQGYNILTTSVYYVDENGNKTKIESRYENGYIVFETDHFSEYVLVDESSEIDPSADCTCNCHKSGFMGFIWKILRIFYKLFKINPVCACGTAHY